MSLTSQILPDHTLTPVQVDHLTTVFNDPTVRDYLKGLARECSRDLLELPILSETPESVHKKHLFVSGQLLVLSTLLSISKE